MTQLDRRALIGAALITSATASSARAQTQSRADIAPLPAHDGPVPVAYLMDEGAVMIDFAGPREAFSNGAPSGAGFDHYIVAPSREPIRTWGGMVIVPDYTLADAPAPKVVVIPAQGDGRQGASTTPAKVEWLRHVAPHADIILSVCTGAFLLARTGLLDGLDATTHHGSFDQFEQQFPNVRLMRGRRFVDNGKFVTAGGLTSGIDGALHVVARYYGLDAARQAAEWMEYESNGWLSGMQEADR